MVHMSIVKLSILIAALCFIFSTAGAFIFPCSCSGKKQLQGQRVLYASVVSGAPPAAGVAAKRPRREITIKQLVETKGGYMAKIAVQNFNEVSQHTVIVSHELYQETCALGGKEDFPVEDYFKAVIKYMIQKGMPLTNTEGMIEAFIFPVNYFSVAQLAHFMDDTVQGVADVIKDM